MKRPFQPAVPLVRFLLYPGDICNYKERSVLAGNGMIMMLGYHLFIAWKNIRRTPKHSLLILVGIALGVAVSTLFSAIYYTYARDPIPEKSGSLYHVRMDSWDPNVAHPMGIPPKLTFQDMAGITTSKIPVRQTGTYSTILPIAPQSRPELLRVETARVCHADFFAMFNVPYRYGSAWTREADEQGESVAVIDDALNRRFFGGRNSVGELVMIKDRPFRVVGVLDAWRPSIRYYDFLPEFTAPVVATQPVERFFIPIHQGRVLLARYKDYALRWKPDPDQLDPTHLDGLFRSETIFTDVWVELQDLEHVGAYKLFLDGYALEQRTKGRFLRPIDNRVTPLLDYLKEYGCPPPEATAMMLVANLVLLACALSLVGLLWARFLARSGETSVRRALGASRRDIFVQHLIECEVIALGGGIVGLGLARLLLKFVNIYYQTISATYGYDPFRIDGAMVAFALVVTVAAGLIAGAYPAYRTCRIEPAFHLKRQ